MSTSTHNSLQQVRTELRANALEKEVQSAILQYLAYERVRHTITNAEEAYNRNGQRVHRVEEGWPDITGCESGTGDGRHDLMGKVLAIEVKRAVGGVLSYEQAVCLQSLWESGAIIAVARSVDDVIEVRRTGRPTQAMVDEILKAILKGPDKKKLARRAIARMQRRKGGKS